MVALLTLLLIIALVSQGFFSGSEMALVSANRAKLLEDADEGDHGAVLAVALLAEEDKLIGTCLVGTNVSVVAGSSIATLLLLDMGLGQEWIATVVFVPIALVFGEALPKTVYGRHADFLAPLLSRPLTAIRRALYVPLAAIQGWTNILVRVRGPIGDIKREDIVDLLEEEGDGDIDPEEKALIRRLFALPETPAESCMTPLVDVVAIPETATVGDAAAIVVRSGHSKLPVFRDRIDNIIGIVSHSDLLYAGNDDRPISELTHPVIFVPETKPTDKLFKQMRLEQHQFAVVVDEYGGSVGLVTIEDLLEEIVGEIQDERDGDEPTIRRLGDRSWLVPARIEIEELAEAIGQAVPEGDYETVAGLILARLGRIPEAGEVVRVGPLTFHVEVATERAIQQVRLTT